MKRSWIWMAIFSLIFLALGGLELGAGDGLAGAGYLVGGLGGALVSEGQRRGADAAATRGLTLTGNVLLVAAAVLLGIHLLG